MIQTGDTVRLRDGRSTRCRLVVKTEKASVANRSRAFVMPAKVILSGPILGYRTWAEAELERVHG